MAALIKLSDYLLVLSSVSIAQLILILDFTLFFITTTQIYTISQECTTWIANILEVMHQTTALLKMPVALHMKIHQMVHTLDHKLYTLIKHNFKT